MTKKKEPFKSWDKERELTTAICEAICIGFVGAIKYDYTIPDYSDIISALQYALAQICGLKPGTRMPSLHEGRIQYTYLAHPEHIPFRIMDGILSVTAGPKDSQTDLENFINADYRFGHEWFMGLGTLYRWRAGKDQLAQINVQKFFTKKEWNTWVQIYKYVFEYIIRTFISKEEL